MANSPPALCYTGWLACAAVALIGCAAEGGSPEDGDSLAEERVASFSRSLLESNADLTIVHLSDLHLRTVDLEHCPDQPELPLKLGELKIPTLLCKHGFTFLRRAIALINEHLQPDLVVITGDIVDTAADEEALRLGADLLRTLRVPYLVVQGDHDANPPQQFARYFSAEAEELTIKGYPIFGLPYDVDAQTLEESILPRFRTRLEQSGSERPGIFCLHRMLYVPLHLQTLAAWRYPQLELYSQHKAALDEFLASSGRPWAVLNGHIHLSSTAQLGQISHYTTTSLATWPSELRLIKFQGQRAQTSLFDLDALERYYQAGGECSAQTCDGCCQEGRCIPLAAAAGQACGSGGAACEVCAEGQTCREGRCESLPAEPSCSGGTCQPYEQCVNGTCVLDLASRWRIKAVSATLRDSAAACQSSATLLTGCLVAGHTCWDPCTPRLGLSCSCGEAHPDPLLALSVGPSEAAGALRAETAHVLNTFSPQWDQELLTVTAQQLISEGLYVRVLDRDGLMPLQGDDLIGQLELHPGAEQLTRAWAGQSVTFSGEGALLSCTLAFAPVR